MEEISSSTQTGASGRKSILRGKMQREMAARFEARGLLGLNKMLISVAEKHNDVKIASWRKFLEFATAEPGETDWVLFYLSSMDPEFLKALLSGTVLKEWEEDAGFAHMMQTKHELRNTPQVHGNGLGRVRTSGINDTQDTRELGRPERWGAEGSPEQILAALKLGWEYLKVNDEATDGLAKEIDRLMPQRHYANSPVKRKYIPTEASLGILRQWFRASIWSLEATMKDMSEEEKKTDVEWAFLEAGFGVSGSNHGSNHVWHDGTNYLFGLVTACMMHPRPHDFRIRTFAIIHVMKPEHADPCEVLARLCGGIYGEQGLEGFGMYGLDPALAKGAVINAPHNEESDRMIGLPTDDKAWEYNRRKAVENRTTILKSKDADMDKLDAWGKALNARAGVIRLGKRIAELPQRMAEVDRELAEAKEAAERGPQSHPELLAALEEYMGLEPEPSPSPVPEVRDEQEGAVVGGSDSFGTELDDELELLLR